MQLGLRTAQWTKNDKAFFLCASFSPFFSCLLLSTFWTLHGQQSRTSYCYDLKSDPYRNSHSPRTTGGFLFTVSQRELTTSVREAKLTVPVSGQNRGRCGVISLLHPVSPPSLTTPSLLYPLTTHSGIKYYVKQNVTLSHSKFSKCFFFLKLLCFFHFQSALWCHGAPSIINPPYLTAQLYVMGMWLRAKFDLNRSFCAPYRVLDFHMEFGPVQLILHTHNQMLCLI